MKRSTCCRLTSRGAQGFVEQDLPPCQTCCHSGQPFFLQYKQFNRSPPSEPNLNVQHALIILLRSMTDADVIIRECTSIEDFQQCIELERAVWKDEDIGIMPVRMYMISRACNAP